MNHGEIAEYGDEVGQAMDARLTQDREGVIVWIGEVSYLIKITERR